MAQGVGRDDASYGSDAVARVDDFFVGVQYEIGGMNDLSALFPKWRQKENARLPLNAGPERKNEMSLSAASFFSFFFLTMVVTQADGAERGSAGNPQLQRGEYLVDHVSMCVECHTPRDEEGRLLKNEYLKGAPVPVKPPAYGKTKWALKAPNIAGLPGYSEEEGVRLLTDGISRDGRLLDPPMPQFRLNREDAKAVVSYLKSLK
ncbi:MAG TPA: c-type cytochrome [Verrucomicrobiae bacterium]|nr:c-type cytochrome [Verrucomicrobiae bacterium]